MSSSDFDDLAEISAGLELDYVVDDDPWANSPFGWIKTLPSRTVGAIGERLVSEWSTKNGYVVERTGDSDADRLISGIRVEIKFSTLWTKNSIYKFQQIRDQNYELIFCLGVSPSSVHAWVIPKEEFTLDREGVAHQHGGENGKDTLWLSFEPANPPAWLKEFGGTLTDCKPLLDRTIQSKTA